MPGAGMAERPGSNCSDCSECSHCAKKSAPRTKEGVRVSVNLRHFFSDQRARAFMWAPYGRCVQWLGRRVARVFGLPNDIALMSRGHMLPVIEPLLMLDRDDPVEVVNMSYVFTAHDSQDIPSGSSRQQNTNESPSTPSTQTTRMQSARGASSTMNIKQENVSQLPTSSQQENRADNENIASFSIGQDSEGLRGQSSDSPNGDDPQELLRLKRHALQLLDEHCNALHEASAPKRLRRRRRRRQPPAADSAPPSPAADSAPPSPAAAPGAVAVVLRNGAGERPPRLVRALSPV
ncbi:uncharacterized protein [Epargyreus clarus]|uniref:uncharacterized protein n=1 Tax=Epargyreus clarus TaxID=520877 RepID=UPI003C2C1B8D